MRQRLLVEILMYIRSELARCVGDRVSMERSTESGIICSQNEAGY